MPDKPIVMDVVFGPYERLDVGGGLMSVLAEFSDGSVEFVLTYFADEISFSRYEFLYKTRAQLQMMFFSWGQPYLSATRTEIVNNN